MAIGTIVATFASHCRSLNRSPFKNRLVFFCSFQDLSIHWVYGKKCIFPYYWVRRVVHQCQWSMFHKVFDHHIYVCVWFCVYFRFFYSFFVLRVSQTNWPGACHIHISWDSVDEFSLLFFLRLRITDVVCWWSVCILFLIYSAGWRSHNVVAQFHKNNLFEVFFIHFIVFELFSSTPPCDCFLGWLFVWNISLLRMFFHF